MKSHFFTSRWLSRLVFACFIVVLLFVHCYSPFSIVFTVEHNPTLGSHTGGLLGSSEPSIHARLSAATDIAAKANIGGIAERTILVMLCWKCAMLHIPTRLHA